MRWGLLLRDVCILFGAVVVGGGIMFGIMKYQQTRTKPNSVLAAETEANTLVTQVSKLMELPKETPTIATVSDIKKLQGQPFFANAQNGDKVLIFVQAKEAVLYRPGENKIVKVSPITMQTSPTPEATTGSTLIDTDTPTPTEVILRRKTIKSTPSDTPALTTQP